MLNRLRGLSHVTDSIIRAFIKDYINSVGMVYAYSTVRWPDKLYGTLLNPITVSTTSTPPVKIWNVILQNLPWPAYIVSSPMNPFWYYIQEELKNKYSAVCIGVNTVRISHSCKRLFSLTSNIMEAREAFNGTWLSPGNKIVWGMVLKRQLQLRWIHGHFDRFAEVDNIKEGIIRSSALTRYCSSPASNRQYRGMDLPDL